MKTDTIFYRLFQSFPGIFFELLNYAPTEAENYQFSSVEIKQLAFRLDGVFLPSETAPDKPIYFAEVQFQSDGNFYSRFFAQIFLYLDKSPLSNDWRGAVIYPTRQVESRQIQRYQELLTSGRVRRIYLDELGEINQLSLELATVKLVTVESENAISIGRQLVERSRQQILDDNQLKEILQLIETILIYKLPKSSRQEIEAMFSLSDLKQTKVYQEALEEGREEGLQEGELRGRQKAKLESVPRLLALGLSVEQVASALDLTIEQVRQVASNQSQD
ncbi:conserved hypothetical protein [Gloeothece citriformis PCC 7424]|uniref:Rpn family recombination-promoting nuclease/putative transposase n=1 Tax=Gloeothece citriformis (strain PCC 7424) TaxID=65393 RepID=B7KBB0_GLOC7|nr:Rpn family recombination-promoting nuclease/putative transposase [Gloeothece citriformis]ACK71466.1 conserved hypothetical protein [Gloeothece citriformis PCC 7424]